MEYENHYSSKSQANLNTVLGALGTAAFVGAGTGGLGGIFGNRTACAEDHCVNRYEAGLQAKISDLESGIALRDANTYNDQKMLEMYKYFDGKIGHIEREICDQKVFNATQTAAMNCMGGQIAQLYSLTKLVVPNASVCPGWGNVTITPATTTAG